MGHSLKVCTTEFVTMLCDYKKLSGIKISSMQHWLRQKILNVSRNTCLHDLKYHILVSQILVYNRNYSVTWNMPDVVLHSVTVE